VDRGPRALSVSYLTEKTMSAMNPNPCSVTLGALLLCLAQPVLAQEGATAPPAAD